MVSEKVDAGLALQTLALTGGFGLTPHGAWPRHCPTTGERSARTGGGSPKPEPFAGAHSSYGASEVVVLERARHAVDLIDVQAMMRGDGAPVCYSGPDFLSDSGS